MPALINRNLTEHRGSPRIYIDDAILDELGVNPEHPFYDREWQDDKLILRLSDTGKYKVSSKTKNGGTVNVIDINTSKLADLFNVNSKLRIAIKKGIVVVQAHASVKAIAEREERFLSRIKNKQPLEIGTLCHGGGIMDRALHEGFKRSGVATVVKFAIEIDDRYLNSSMRNNACLFNENTVFINSDVADVSTKNMPTVDMLVAGLPCTGASVAGKAKNKIQYAEEHESAGAVFFSYLNNVKDSNPAVSILENVKQYLNTASFAVIKSVMGHLGYDLYVETFNGLDFGASESRERMVCIAISKGLNAAGILQDIAEQIENQKTAPTPLKAIIEDIPLNDPRWKEVTYLKEKEKKDKAAGKGFAMQILTNESTYCGTIGAGYAKARSTEPRLQHPTNPDLSRLFTKTEHAKIKKAPVDIVDGLSETVAHQILGNGVIFSLFESVGYAIGTSVTSPNHLKLAA